MTQNEFEALLQDASKHISGDIMWAEDEYHSPTVEFRVEVVSETNYPLFIKGSFNPLAQALSYVLIHRAVGRIYALDLGKEHHNPSCNNVGEKHKHRWNEKLRDKEAYVPLDITGDVNDPVLVWTQFCKEAGITHNGVLEAPPPIQLEFPL